MIREFERLESMEAGRGRNLTPSGKTQIGAQGRSTAIRQLTTYQRLVPHSIRSAFQPPRSSRTESRKSTHLIATSSPLLQNRLVVYENSSSSNVKIMVWSIVNPPVSLVDESPSALEEALQGRSGRCHKHANAHLPSPVEEFSFRMICMGWSANR